MPWQQQVADTALEIDPDTGLLAYREVVLTVPRQAGKTLLGLAVKTHRCLGFGEPQNVLYTAQDRIHALAKWEDDQVPALQATPLSRLFTVRRQRGQEAIRWANGSRWGITAPNESAGHSQTLDLGFVDEAWARTDNKLETGLSPTMITRPEPQLWTVSTAGTVASTWLRGKVDAGREQPDGRSVAYFEWSASPDADPADPATWWACIPSLGHTVTEEAIHAEHDRLDPDAFARSYLNQWPDEQPAAEWLVITEGDWQVCLDPRSQHVGRVAFGLDVSPDRAWASIAAAGRRGDDLTHVELVDHQPGTGWVVPRLVQLVERHSPVAVVVDPGSATGALLPALDAAGVETVRTTARDVAAASAAMFDACQPDQASLRHIGQPALTAAVAGAVQRPLGDGWTWNRRGATVCITPLVACSLAAWGYACSPGVQLFVAAG
jgi:phage terminase large subunit-like protein